MADITMCSGTGCPLKKKCYRYTAPKNEYRQSYFMEVPGKVIDGEFKCEHYYPNEKRNHNSNIQR